MLYSGSAVEMMFTRGWNESAQEGWRLVASYDISGGTIEVLLTGV
jgi:hypothetical protein